jgi:purine-binding chemotaxis protein CheW
MVAITPIPQVNHAIEGIINVHGDTVPIINLRRHLDMAEAPFKLHTHIILAQNDGRTFGLIVDQVMDVLSLPADQIADPDQILPEGLGEAPLLRGLVHTPEGTVLLLNLEQMFRPQQAQALAQAMEAMVEEAPAQ